LLRIKRAASDITDAANEIIMNPVVPIQFGAGGLLRIRHISAPERVKVSYTKALGYWFGIPAIQKIGFSGKFATPNSRAPAQPGKSVRWPL
jgi:hypothetical protein